MLCERFCWRKHEAERGQLFEYAESRGKESSLLWWVGVGRLDRINVKYVS